MLHKKFNVAFQTKETDFVMKNTLYDIKYGKTCTIDQLTLFLIAKNNLWVLQKLFQVKNYRPRRLFHTQTTFSLFCAVKKCTRQVITTPFVIKFIKPKP